MNDLYGKIAPYYDALNAGIDYDAWADDIDRVFRQYRIPGNLVLDLACGTGSMTLALDARGYDMTGVDISSEMLSVARGRSEGKNILWLCQDMAELDLYGTVDGAVCCLDSINHVTDPKTLARAFTRLHTFLAPGGIFVFDVNSAYKFRTVYGTNDYILEDEGVLCAWSNYYDEAAGECEFNLSIFREGKDGRYDRTDEIQKERYYPEDMLRQMLADAGFEVLSVAGDLDGRAPQNDDERLYFVARVQKG